MKYQSQEKAFCGAEGLKQNEIPQVKSVEEIDVDNFMKIGESINANGADIFLIAHNKAQLWATFDPDEGEPNELTRAARQEAYRSYKKGFTDSYYVITPIVATRISDLESENARLREALEKIASTRDKEVKYVHPIMLVRIAEKALNPNTKEESNG